MSASTLPHAGAGPGGFGPAGPMGGPAGFPGRGGRGGRGRMGVGMAAGRGDMYGPEPGYGGPMGPGMGMGPDGYGPGPMGELLYALPDASCGVECAEHSASFVCG